MMTRFLNSELRPISIIGFLQCVVVVAGVILTTAMLKMHGYGTDMWPEHWFPAVSVRVRNYGGWLLLMPVAWVLLALYANRRAVKAVWLYPAVVVGGMALVVYGIYFFVRTGLNTSPITPWMWIEI